MNDRSRVVVVGVAPAVVAPPLAAQPRVQRVRGGPSPRSNAAGNRALQSMRAPRGTWTTCSQLEGPESKGLGSAPARCRPGPLSNALAVSAASNR